MMDSSKLLWIAQSFAIRTWLSLCVVESQINIEVTRLLRWIANCVGRLWQSLSGSIPYSLACNIRYAELCDKYFDMPSVARTDIEKVRWLFVRFCNFSQSLSPTFRSVLPHTIGHLPQFPYAQVLCTGLGGISLPSPCPYFVQLAQCRGGLLSSHGMTRGSSWILPWFFPCQLTNSFASVSLDLFLPCGWSHS